MTSPRKQFDGSDFDRVAAWANANLRSLVETYAHVKLNRHGRSACPLHGGKNPEAFSVSKTGWHCFTGCNTGGDGVDFVRRLRYSGLNDREGRVAAIFEIAPSAGVHLERPRGYTAPPVSTYTPPVRLVEPAAKTWAEENRERIARDLEAMRSSGHPPATPSEVLATAHSAMSLSEQGRIYLENRGLHVPAAEAFGFRSIESHSQWQAIADTLASCYAHVECENAGLWRMPVQIPSGDGTRRDATPALVIPYHDLQRNVIGWRMREMSAGVFGTKPNGEPRRYHSLAGSTLAWPFNAPDLADLAGHELHVLEGEFNAFALACHGARAVGLDGAGKWNADWTPLLRNASRVVLWYDDDAAGAAGRTKLATHLAETFGRSWVQTRGRTMTLHGIDVNDAHRDGALATILEQAAWRE